MKGFVPTPPHIVELMVGKLFAERAPTIDDRVLDPGCGDGEFIEGVLRACQAQGWPVPRLIGIEQDPVRAASARARFARVEQVEIRTSDFLEPLPDRFNFIIGNPPYVAITGLDGSERERYRARYQTATGRFDLYALFFEQALRLLSPRGRLVFITPEKFLYVETARRLRQLLLEHGVAELHMVDEATFGDKVTYPLITTIATPPSARTSRVIRRGGSTSTVHLRTADSWQPAVQGYKQNPTQNHKRLADVSVRISCGVATGADGVFVLPTLDVPEALRSWAHPTISGRQILPSHQVTLPSSLLAPYDGAGRLIPEQKLGALGEFLGEPGRRRQLEGRTCVGAKPWYAFHDNFPVAEMLRPKLLCKDITAEPFFVLDRGGRLAPRHSVYYLVPACGEDLESLAEYLNSPAAIAWLKGHCQRAANGFLRMQSHVLKQLPIPTSVAPRSADLVAAARGEALLLA